MAAVIDDLLKVPERENGGRTAYDRFDFQTAWGISKVIDLHKAGANYAVGFEFHDDLIELDDADSPTTAVFYQMKSLDSGHWTLSRILDRPVAGKKKQTLKASIAGKMFDNIKRFGAVVGKLVMVSNQPLSEAGAKYEEVPLATLDAADVTKFVTAMKLECRAFKEADHLGFFYYEQCRLGLGSYEDAVFGQVGMLLHDRNIDAKPRPVEMRLVNDLFGMSSGWVLDFSNRTFEEFFRQEVGIEIYDDAYGFIGTSKGKHLSAFLQVGQSFLRSDRGWRSRKSKLAAKSRASASGRTGGDARPNPAATDH